MLQDGPFNFRASLEGMAPEDCLRLEMPGEFLGLSVSQLLDRAFPATQEERDAIEDQFDLRDNPDLPDIYAVFLAVCEEWRDWRCALHFSAESREEVDLDTPVSQLIFSTEEAAHLSLHLEQRYCAIEFAVRHGFWSGRDELLDWMRGLTVLYFIDKHEVPLSSATGSAPALARAVDSLQTVGAVALPGDPSSAGPPSFAITPEGRMLIASLLDETEGLIDNFDHYKDVAVNADAEVVEFDTGRGLDLRVEAFLAEGIDPVRAVFLLRLYDGTLDRRLADWQAAIEDDFFYDGILEPVVNRDGADEAEMEMVIESGLSLLEEREEQAKREQDEREILRRAEGESPSP